MSGEARRVVFPAVREAAWETLPLPDRPGPTEALLRAACTAVSAGTEIAIYSGSHIGFATPGARYPRLPYNPGYAFAGTVEAVGEGVRSVRPGDRVLASLRHQDRVLVDAESDLLDPIPEGVTFEQACLARLATIAMHGVRLGRVALGEHVAVFGQGLIGQLARQLAAIDGAATLIAVDPLTSRLDVARRHGATHTVDPSREDAAGAVLDATAGRGVDVAIEATGHPPVINDALRAAAPLGRVVLLGSPRGRVEIDPYNDVHRKGVSLIGAHANTTAGAGNPYHRWTLTEQRRLSLELIRQGRLRTDGLVTHRVPADQALPVWEGLATRPQDYLGVVLIWSDGAG